MQLGKFAAGLAIVLTGFVAGAGAQDIETSSTNRNVAARSENSVPRLVQFNGTLKDSAARSVEGVVSVTFALYAEQDGGAPLWTETQNVFAEANGHYNALLGTATSGGFPAELFSASSGSSRWLGVTVARQPEQPRVLLASVPYALKAADADTLGGLPASSYVTTQQLAARGAVAALATTTVIAGSGTPAALAPTSTSAVELPGAGSSVTQAAVTGTGTTNYLPLWTSGSNLGVSKIYQANGGFVGINTNTPLLQLDVNGNSIFRGSFQLAPQAAATAAEGQPSHSFQWQGSVYNSGTHAAQNEAFGFRTVPDANNVANPTAKLDLFYGSGGGTLTDTGLSINHAGLITFAPNQTFTGGAASFDNSIASVDMGQSTTYGLSVSTMDPTGLIVFSGASSSNAVEGDAEGAGGFGVVGSGGEAGVVGMALTDSGLAGKFEGDVQVTGTLSKSGGSFKIDDPLDPANKYLSHSFVESPDMMNLYNGNVTTDAKGFAVVTMPAWFEPLNRDFRYQLTVMGQFAQAIIAKEIAQGRFTIQTDKPNVKVSWMVTGVRQDAWANAHRIPVEQDKAEMEKGHYLSPELFGHAGEPGLGALRRAADGKLVPIRKQQPAVAQK
jgi:trimeric autotransporter adhesin